MKHDTAFLNNAPNPVVPPNAAAESVMPSRRIHKLEAHVSIVDLSQHRHTAEI